jgi:hypothetical protein
VLQILEAKLRETRGAVESNTRQLFEFTHANIVGMSRYIEQWKPGQSLLANSPLAALVNAALALAFDSHQAWLLGKETPSTLPNPDGGPVTETPPSGDCEVGAVAKPADRAQVTVTVACSSPRGGARVNTSMANREIVNVSLDGGGTCLALALARWTCFLEDALVATLRLTGDGAFGPGALIAVDPFSMDMPVNEQVVVVS